MKEFFFLNFGDRDERKADTDAEQIMIEASIYFLDECRKVVADDEENASEIFWETIAKRMADIVVRCGSDLPETIGQDIDTLQTENCPSLDIRFFRAVCITCAFCLMSMKSMKTEQKDEAWTFTVDAYSGLHYLQFLSNEQSNISTVAKKAANARHAENRKYAESIKQWFIENRAQFKTLDAAAEAATKIEPVKRRTAYKHIAEVEKLLRSTRKL